MYNKLIAYANKNGFEFKPIYHHSGDPTPCGVVIATDYYGAYPPEEVHKLHSSIREWAYKHRMCTEQRGHYTGIAVYSN